MNLTRNVYPFPWLPLSIDLIDVDPQGILRHVQYVGEVAEKPDYSTVIDTVKTFLGRVIPCSAQSRGRRRAHRVGT